MTDFYELDTVDILFSVMHLRSEFTNSIRRPIHTRNIISGVTGERA